MKRVIAALSALVAVLVLGGWAVSSVDAPKNGRAQPVRATSEPSTVRSSSTTVESALDETQPSEPAQASSTVAASVVDEPRRLADAAGLPAPRTRRAPIGLSIASLEVGSAPVRSAGVLANGEMEIPAPTEVGWYRYGASPGDDGSAVLAAHIAASGVDGVFRHLDTLSLGAEIVVLYDDGSTSTWEVIERTQYDKDSLPVDEMFARSGPPRLTLVTCGGAFNPSVRSYEDNVIVVAAPA